MLLRAVSVRSDRLQPGTIRSGNLKGNSRSHAVRLAQFALEGNPKPDSYVRLEPLEPWQTHQIDASNGDTIEITAAPARHGPAGIEPLSGDVTGFVLSSKSKAFKPVYVTGDTVWFDGVAEVQRRFEPGLVLLFGGAAQTRGKFNLTMNANDAIEAACAFASASIVPVHTDGWAHFTESGDDLEHAFKVLGHAGRLRRLTPGIAAVFSL